MSEIDGWVTARNRALIALDLDFARRVMPDASDDVLIRALHKTRYECVHIDPSLRHESRRWLEAGGWSRIDGLPFPNDGSLPA